MDINDNINENISGEIPANTSDAETSVTTPDISEKKRGRKEKNTPRKKRKVSIGLTVFLVLLSALISFQTTYVVLTNSYKLKLNKAYDTVSDFRILLEAYDIFSQNY
ncbi:MAG: hypothetical protein ACI4QR_04785, partial [Eubacteriales bacterium]